MCTWLGRKRGSTVLLIDGICCCLSVESFTPHAPSIRWENGWRPMDTYSHAEMDGFREVRIRLPEEAMCSFHGTKPVATFEFRGRRVVFGNRHQILATRNHVASALRRTSRSDRHRPFLANLPAELLRPSARVRVTRKLDELLARTK